MLVYQCTVCDEGATIWNGSLFSCGNQVNRISLRHRLFENGSAIGDCNGGAVIAQSVGVSNINNSPCYLSQLTINITDIAINNRSWSVSCIHFDGVDETIIGTTTLHLKTGLTVEIHYCDCYCSIHNTTIKLS